METSSLGAAALALKALLRRRDSRLAILALALPLAVLASLTATANHLGAEAGALAAVAGRGEAHYLAHSEDVMSPEIVGEIRGVRGVEVPVALRVEETVALLGGRPARVRVVGADSIDNLLKLRRARITGGGEPGEGEALAGVLLAERLGLKPGDTVELTTCCSELTLRISGILSSTTPLDDALVASLEAVERLAGPGITDVEFRAAGEAAAGVEELLPPGTLLVRLGDPPGFAAGVEEQILGYLDWWALTVYLVVAATSYVAAARLAEEAGREAGLLKTLGAGRGVVLAALLAYIAAVAAAAGLLGAAMGLAGSQTASTILWWLGAGRPLAPFLEAWDAARMVGLSVAAALAGALYPAYRLSGEKL